MEDPAGCDFCGEGVPAGGPPLTWTSAVEDGRTRWFCEACSRRHLRSMEGRLDSRWW